MTMGSLAASPGGLNMPNLHSGQLRLEDVRGQEGRELDCLLVYFCVLDRSVYVAQASLKLTILLLQPLKC